MTETTVDPASMLTSEHGTQTRLIKDSISVAGDRVTTFETRIWRSMLSEFNTHRVFSRNSASSRAIPLLRQVERIEEDTAGPAIWAAEQKGMSGGAEIEDVANAEYWWGKAKDAAVEAALSLGHIGVHKSICNRLLEPFMWHTIVVTATSYKNFFGLRCSPGAQPEIRIAAEQMQQLFEASEPKTLINGQWHLPYIEVPEIEQAEEWMADLGGAGINTSLVEVLVQMSSARCAAVSYMRHADWRSVQKDVDLYAKLTDNDPMHASPLEHPCTPNPDNKHSVMVRSQFTNKTKMLTLPRYGNFLGWHQHRADVEVDANYQAFV